MHKVLTSVTLTFDIERPKTIQHSFKDIYTSIKLESDKTTCIGNGGTMYLGGTEEL